MKKFLFRLEPVLRLKSHREREKQKELSAIQFQVEKQKQGLAGLDTCRLVTMDTQRKRLLGRLSIAELLVYSRFLLRLKGETLAGRELMQSLQKDAEEKRLRLVAAARERKMLEKLKEKQYGRFRHQIQQAERKANDEIAITAYQRGKTSH